MTIFTSMREDIGEMLQDKIRIKLYLGSIAATGFDDAQVFTSSGTEVWDSGLVLPIKAVEGSTEAVLLQQGKIKTTDKRLYIRGNVATTAPSPEGAIKIGVGSPTPTEHSLIPDGIEAWPPQGDLVYKKLFIREIVGGSFIGE